MKYEGIEIGEVFPQDLKFLKAAAIAWPEFRELVGADWPGIDRLEKNVRQQNLPPTDEEE